MARIIPGRRAVRPTATPDALIVPNQGLTGRHVVAVAVILALAVVFYPVGVKASGGSLVSIVDGGTTTNKVKVDPTGALRAQPALQQHPWYFRVHAEFTATAVPLFNAPTGTTKLAITSLTFINFNTVKNEPSLYVYPAVGCGGGSPAVVHQALLAPESTFAIAFPSPLVVDVTGGKSVCLSSGANTDVDAVGFYL